MVDGKSSTPSNPTTDPNDVKARRKQVRRRHVQIHGSLSVNAVQARVKAAPRSGNVGLDGRAIVALRLKDTPVVCPSSGKVLLYVLCC